MRKPRKVRTPAPLAKIDTPLHRNGAYFALGANETLLERLHSNLDIGTPAHRALAAEIRHHVAWLNAKIAEIDAKAAAKGGEQ
jgi:hypothetical protein